MRVKTDSKRREILQAAAAVFAERGYHETTIAQIAAHMSSSKATIYNYFDSKVELFEEMLIEAARPYSESLLRHLAAPGPLARRLERFAREYVEANASDVTIAVMRLIISEFGRSNLGERLSVRTAEATWPPVIEHLRAAQAAGELGDGDPEEMARQFRALLDGGMPMQRLRGLEKRFTLVRARAAADEAVRCFLAAYGARG